MTVNHGVLGSSPRGGANKKALTPIKGVSAFLFAHNILFAYKLIHSAAFNCP
jgi:hypothetical protein